MSLSESNLGNLSGSQADSSFTTESNAFESTVSATADNTPNFNGSKAELNKLNLKNIGRIIVGYLNMNSIRNKFDALKEVVSQNIDILMAAET